MEIKFYVTVNMAIDISVIIFNKQENIIALRDA